MALSGAGWSSLGVCLCCVDDLVNWIFVNATNLEFTLGKIRELSFERLLKMATPNTRNDVFCTYPNYKELSSQGGTDMYH